MMTPDYSGHGLVNVLATLEQALGDRSPRGAPDPAYPPATQIDLSALQAARTVILLVADGLGYDMLPPEGVLSRNLLGKLTSVFPSSTAAAIPTFFSGMAPRAHGLTGWHMFFRELGAMLAVLPYRLRGSRGPSVPPAAHASQLLRPSPFFARLSCDSHVVAPHRIVDSEFNQAFSGPARRHGYDTVEDLFAALAALAALARQGENKQYIYAYFPDIDSAAHQHGTRSDATKQAIRTFEDAFEAFLADAAGTDTALILTADHGLIDTVPEDEVALDHHPELLELLSLPVSGEPRVGYCYVKPGREASFERYVGAHLNDVLTLERSEDVLSRGWFGPGPTHPSFTERIGDYMLLMKDRRVWTQWLPGEKPYRLIGVHGGLDLGEMEVPLIFRFL